MPDFFAVARFCAFALLLPLSAVAAAQLVQTGDLSELVAAAAADNPELAAQKSALAAAGEEDNIARAPLLPQIQFGASKILQRDGGGNNNNDGENRSIFISASQHVFNLPLWENYRSGVRRVEAAAARYAAAKQALELSVAEAWLDLQLAGDLMRLAQTRVDSAEERYVRAKSFAESGIGTAVDVLDAGARLAELRADFLQNEYNYNLAQDRLHNLSGMHGRRARLVRDNFRKFQPLAALGRWLAR
ncbi:MAG: TolC family protein, partial [Betaproteobacteria bacterium]|nr:TolC family protein [Betaproteobacteria bacterium]